MTTKDDEDDANDSFKSLHQLVSCLSEVSKSSSETEGRDSSNKGLAFTPSASSSSESGSSSHKTSYPSTVLLENLVENVCILDLRIILEEYGEVKDLRLMPGRPDSVSARATFDSQEEAEYAVQRLDGIEADGRILACRLIETPLTTEVSLNCHSHDATKEEAIEPASQSCKDDLREPEEGVEVETLPLKGHNQVDDNIRDEEEEESTSLREPAKLRLVEWTLDAEIEPAETLRDALEGQQKIPVHESERLPRFLRRVAVEAKKSPSLADFPDRQLPPHRLPSTSHALEYKVSQQAPLYMAPTVPLQGSRWSAYETMYSGGSNRPTSVTGSPVQAQNSTGPSHLRYPFPPNPYYQHLQPYQPYQPGLLHPAGYNAYPYNLYNSASTISFPSATAAEDLRNTHVDELLKEAGIDNLQKLKMLAPDLRSLELLIVDLSKEYPRSLPSFGDRFYVKNILRQYLHL